MKVIGTAGHIDHGKSTLVHRLTGIDPDRLEEEKRRGMTIDLGFAWLTLPSGERVSIVDVPGHERFVKNMLAGAAGIDVALIVVAADESVMPQTREHVQILDLLGVQSAVVALTKTDLVDGEWLALVEEDVRELLAGTPLVGSPVVPVSATTGSGLEALVAALDQAVSTAAAREDRGVAFLPVDRVFSAAGFGTVVTGTLHGGSLSAVSEVTILPASRPARIRALQVHGQTIVEAPPGVRLAVNLAGVSRPQIQRGDVLAVPGTVPTVTRFDARVRVVEDSPVPVRHGETVSLHVGAAERTAKVSVLVGNEIPAGAEGWIQLRTTDPVAVVARQAFVLRLPAPARTVAGGRVLDVDPHHRRSDLLAVERLQGLSSPDPATVVLAALRDARPRTPASLALLLGMPVGSLEPLLSALAAQSKLKRLGSRYLTTDSYHALADRLFAALGEYHRTRPLRPGMPKEEARSRARIQPDLWGPFVTALEADMVIKQDGATVALAGHIGGTANRREETERVQSVLAVRGVPMGGTELAREAATDTGLVAALASEGAIVAIERDTYLSREQVERVTQVVLRAIEREGQITVGALRDELGTSRKHAVALMDYLDGQHITRRRGDVHISGSKAPECV